MTTINYKKLKENVLNTIQADIREGNYRALEWLIDQIEEGCGATVLQQYLDYDEEQ